MGLSIPPFAIATSIEIDIPMLDHNGHIQPPAFFSKHIDGVANDLTTSLSGAWTIKAVSQA